ncbi:MAG: trigger factor [Terriglobales bacterium]
MAAAGECNRNLEIEIPAGEVEREATRIAQEWQKRARIAGFRPGKAPLTLVRQRYSGKIREETLETLIPAHLRAAFEREGLEPVSEPKLDELDYKPGAAVKFKASFEILPPFELGDYRAIRAEKPAVEVAPSEVDSVLNNLQLQHAKYEVSPETEMREGLVGLVEARRATAAGEAAEAAQELKIEAGGPDTLPEFTAALMGMKPGEEREFEVHYPGDYPNRTFAGTSQRYQLKLTGIEAKTLPELNDVFAQEATGESGLEPLRQRIEAGLRREREHEARHTVENAVLDQLLAQTPVVVPESLVDKQVEVKLERNIRSLVDQGIDPRKLKLDWVKLRDQQQESARREVAAALVLDKIAARENIEASAEAVEHEIHVLAGELKQTPESVRARLTDNGALDRIKNRIRQGQVMEMLAQSATGGGFSAAAGEAQEPATP